LGKNKIIFMAEGELLEFYGTECPHCITMKPLVEKLEREAGVTVEKLEVWHNENNLSVMEDLDKGKCGGVPFFFNKKTGKWICGATSYEKLKEWALGK
jgi:thiol-disulfide isomerase/thioredoxin